MAEFDVTLSAMADAATNIGNYTQQFKDQADQTYQAAKTLSETWTGDASQTFVESMEQLHNWMTQMAEVLDSYSTSLKKARNTFEIYDVGASRNFK